MQSFRDAVQNYFNNSTIIRVPSTEEVGYMTSIVIRLPHNQYCGPDYIRNTFEASLQFGIIERIDQIVNTWNETEYQCIYIVKFATVFADNLSFLYFADSLQQWGYYDACLLFDINASINVRVFYDNFIDSYNKTNPVLDLTSTFAVDNTQLLKEQIYSDMQKNYEHYESIVESDINMLEEKNNLLSNELDFTKQELQKTQNAVDDLKEQFKWMNKIFYQRVKDTDANLRDDFKEFVSAIQPSNRNRRRNRSRNTSQNLITSHT
jgi:hypothetical protein